MDVDLVTPPVSGFLKIKLDQNIIDYLWKIIDIGKTTNKDFKNKLVGNISQSFLYFFIHTSANKRFGSINNLDSLAFLKDL